MDRFLQRIEAAYWVGELVVLVLALEPQVPAQQVPVPVPGGLQQGRRLSKGQRPVLLLALAEQVPAQQVLVLVLVLVPGGLQQRRRLSKGQRGEGADASIHAVQAVGTPAEEQR